MSLNPCPPKPLPLKPEYGPTLPQLLAPRWRAAKRATRVLIVALAGVLVAGVAALVLMLLPASISHGGRTPFHFSYRSLHSTAPEAGGYVRVQRRDGDGRLEDSFAVGPLHLPPYTGGLSGELPLYASGYVRTLATRMAGFRLRGEGVGKTRANAMVAYNIYFDALVQGRTMYGRDVLLVPERPRAREGVVVAMLTTPGANAEVTSPLLVATAGVLYEPLRTFTFD